MALSTPGGGSVPTQLSRLDVAAPYLNCRVKVKVNVNVKVKVKVKVKVRVASRGGGRGGVPGESWCNGWFKSWFKSWSRERVGCHHRIVGPTYAQQLSACRVGARVGVRT